MKKPITVCVSGLGHPEGPYELDDGRVIYANSYVSEIGVWDPKTGKAGTFAKVGGGPNACMLGSDGCVYSTQTPNVGAWVAPIHRPPSIQKTSPSGEVEILVAEADGVKFDGPNDLAFGPDGRLYFTDSGDWGPETKPASGAHRRHREDRRGAHSRRTRACLSQRHRRRARRLARVGRVLYVECRSAKARR